MTLIVSCPNAIENMMPLPHNECVNIGEGYLDKIKARRKDSARVSKPYQLIGLEIADILGDRRHKALYIKLAKEMNAIELLRLAKTVADQRGVQNKGAYFMSIVTGTAEQPEAEPKKILGSGRTRYDRQKNK